MLLSVAMHNIAVTSRRLFSFLFLFSHNRAFIQPGYRVECCLIKLQKTCILYVFAPHASTLENLFLLSPNAAVLSPTFSLGMICITTGILDVAHAFHSYCSYFEQKSVDVIN